MISYLTEFDLLLNTIITTIPYDLLYMPYMYRYFSYLFFFFFLIHYLT